MSKFTKTWSLLLAFMIGSMMTINAQEFAIEPESHDFGEVGLLDGEIYYGVDNAEFSVFNEGSGSFSVVTEPYFFSGQPDYFSYEGDASYPYEIAGPYSETEESLDFEVAFNPTTGGEYNTLLVIEDDMGRTTRTFELSGSAYDIPDYDVVENAFMIEQDWATTPDYEASGLSYADFYDDYHLDPEMESDVVYHFSVEKASFLSLTANGGTSDFAVFPESTTEFVEGNNIYEGSETPISEGGYYIIASGAGDVDFNMHVEGQEPILVVEPESMDLGDVPIDCWDEGGTFKVYNDGGQTITIESATLSDENGVYTLDHKYEFPKTISTDTLYFDVHLDASEPGTYDAAFLLEDEVTTRIYDITGTAYNAPEGDAFCNPFIATFDGEGHYEHEGTVGDPMRDNYSLMEGYGDVVYAFEYTTDMILDLAVDNSAIDPHMAIFSAAEIAQGTPGTVDPIVMEAASEINDIELWAGTYYVVLAGDPSVEDPTYTFTMDVEDMPEPGDVTLNTPVDQSDEISVDTALTWTLGEYTNNVDVYLDTQYPPENKILGGGDPTESIDVDGLSPAQIYFWKVVAHNQNGSTESETWAFTTELPAPKWVSGEIFDYVNVHLEWTNPLETTLTWTEDFENGEMPDGWTNMTNGTGSTAGWFVTDDGASSSFEIPPHTTYAVSNDDMTDDDSSMDYLVTPEEDFAGWSEITLTFESFFDGSFGQTAAVELSTDGGETWEVVHELEANDSWTEIQLDLTEYATDEYSPVWIGFHANDNGGWASGWAVDDIVLEKEEGQGSNGNRALTGYNIYQDGEKVNEELVTETQYDVTELTAGTYEFGVSAVYNEGESEIATIDPIEILGMSGIEGTVSDYASGDPIAEASITMSGVNADGEDVEYSTTTDADGFYTAEVPVLADGYEVEASASGYVSQTEEVTPEAGTFSTVNFEMGEFPIPVSNVVATESGDESQAIITWDEPSEFPTYEISYDDGTPENATGWNTGYEGNMNAVKFTPQGYPATIKTAKIHIYDGSWPDGDILSPMEVVVLDDDGASGMPGTELGVVEVTPSDYNWVEIDLSSLNITVDEGSFYIANRQISVWPDAPPTAIDETNPQGLSYAYSDGSWGTADYDHFMIRAGVAGPRGEQLINYDGNIVNVKETVSEGAVSATPTAGKEPGSYVEGEPTITQVSEAPENSSREVQQYEVWRFTEEDAQNPDNWTLLADDVTETEYTDGEWADLDYGVYGYAVKAIYPITESDPAQSNLLPNNMFSQAIFFVSTNTEESAEGALFKMENMNNDTIYETTVPADGTVDMAEVWKGDYLLTVAKEGYEPYSEQISITESYYIDSVNLIEALATPVSFAAEKECNDVFLSWEEGSTGNVEWTQDFEGLFPPEGWTKQENEGQGWFQTSDGSSSFFTIPPHDSQYACSNDDQNDDDSSMDYLISPVQNFNGFTTGSLTFESFYSGAYSQEAYVELSTDGGDTWEVIHTVEASDSWEEITIDLEDYLTSEYSQVWIGFHADDAGAWASGWAIDNVNLQLSVGAENNNSREFLGFNLYRNDVKVNNQPISGTEYTDEDLAGGMYHYYVTSQYSTGESDPSEIDSVDVQVINPAENLTAEKQSWNNIRLEWDAPADQPIYTLQWDNGENFTGIGTDSEYDFSVASRWYPEDLETYDGQYLTEVSFYPMEEQSEYYVRVWTGSDATLVVDQLVPADEIEINAWNTVELSNPVQIDASEQFWFGYRANTQAGYPAGADEGPAVAGKGDMMWDAESGWVSMSETYGLDYNWNLAGTVTAGEGDQGTLTQLPDNSSSVKEGTVSQGPINDDPEPLNLEDRAFTGYNIYRNDTYSEEDTTLAEGYQQLFYIDYDVNVPQEGIVYTYYVVAQYDEGCTASAAEASVSFGTGADKGTAENISVYPNPASDYIKLDVTDNVESYRVINTVGQLLIDKKVTGDEVINVNTESYEPGSYVVQFITESGDVVSKRFVLVK